MQPQEKQIACVMESFYSVSDMHLELMLWVGTEYLICAVFSCNLSHLGHPVCHCDLFQIFWHLKKKVSKNTTMPDCFTVSQISAFLLACPAILPPKFWLSSLSCKCTDHQNRLCSEPCLSNEHWSYIVCYQQRPLLLFEMREKILAQGCVLGQEPIFFFFWWWQSIQSEPSRILLFIGTHTLIKSPGPILGSEGSRHKNFLCWEHSMVAQLEMVNGQVWTLYLHNVWLEL